MRWMMPAAHTRFSIYPYKMLQTRGLVDLRALPLDTASFYQKYSYEVLNFVFISE